MDNFCRDRLGIGADCGFRVRMEVSCAGIGWEWWIMGMKSSDGRRDGRDGYIP